MAYFENPGRYRAGQRSLRGLSKRTIPFHCLGNVRDIRRLRMAHIFNNLRKIAAVWDKSYYLELLLDGKNFSLFPRTRYSVEVPGSKKAAVNPLKMLDS